MTRSVGIYIYDDVEVLDFAGPFEVFSTASRVKSRLDPNAPKTFEVFTIADSMRNLRARGGLMVYPNFDINNHPPVDLFVVPGGDPTAECERKEIIDWITRTASKTIVTASVCTGAFLLGKAGLLRGRAATTHWSDIEDLRIAFPDTTVQTDKRWVDGNKIVTSAGISAGLDMSLHLVARVENRELALRTARQMEYEPARDVMDRIGQKS
jgi:transcriptional regulator GlxA family with amidase domain